MLPRVPWLRTLPLYLGGLRRCHASLSSGPHLASGVGFSIAMCPLALNRTSSLKRLRCCHTSYGLLWVMG
jgi:hypothetical protein